MVSSGFRLLANHSSFLFSCSLVFSFSFGQGHFALGHPTDTTQKICSQRILLEIFRIALFSGQKFSDAVRAVSKCRGGQVAARAKPGITCHGLGSKPTRMPTEG